MIGGEHDCGIQGDVWPQLMFRYQAQIDIQLFGALRQRQQEVAAQQRLLCRRRVTAGADFTDQFVIVQNVEFQL